MMERGKAVRRETRPPADSLLPKADGAAGSDGRAAPARGLKMPLFDKTVRILFVVLLALARANRFSGCCMNKSFLSNYELSD
jgi:hypothetical protein